MAGQEDYLPGHKLGLVVILTGYVVLCSFQIINEKKLFTLFLEDMNS